MKFSVRCKYIIICTLTLFISYCFIFNDSSEMYDTNSFAKQNTEENYSIKNNEEEELEENEIEQEKNTSNEDVEIVTSVRNGHLEVGQPVFFKVNSKANVSTIEYQIGGSDVKEGKLKSSKEFEIDLPKQAGMYIVKIALEDENGNKIKNDETREEYTTYKFKVGETSEKYKSALKSLGIENIELSGIPEENQRKIVESIEFMCNRFPIIKEILKSVTCDWEADENKEYVSASNTNFEEKGGKINCKINLTPEAFCRTDSDELDLENNSDGELSATGIKATMFHELAHVIEIYLCKEESLENGDSLQNIWNSSSFYNELVANAIKITNSNLETDLSKYATENSSEAVAEAFAEYYTSDNPRPLCTEIVTQVINIIEFTKQASSK